MRALFIGGTVDNSELDLELNEAPRNYPTDSAGRTPRYSLYEVGKREGEPVYAVYASPEMGEDEIERIIDERQYVRRFGVADGGERVGAR
jgi:hypothetical protein